MLKPWVKLNGNIQDTDQFWGKRVKPRVLWLDASKKIIETKKTLMVPYNLLGNVLDMIDHMSLRF